jgi:hypothetical protein
VPRLRRAEEGPEVTRADPLAPPTGIQSRDVVARTLAKRDRAPADMLQMIVGCPPPVWMNRETDKRPDGQCTWFDGTLRCPQRATHLAWIGCTVGEHLDKSGVCATHVMHMARWKAELHCLRCYDALGIISDARVIKTEKMEESS